MIYNTGSPALYRKYRLYRKSRLIPEVPPYTGSPAPIPEAPPTCQSIILTGGVWYLLLTSLLHFCAIINLIYFSILSLDSKDYKDNMFEVKQLIVRSHRKRRERQSGRTSFIFNESQRRAPARAAQHVLDNENVEES